MNTQEAISLYTYYLSLNIGGEDSVDLYFNLGSDDEDAYDWYVEDCVALYNGHDVTKIIDPEVIDKYVAIRSEEVNQQIEDRMVDILLLRSSQEDDGLDDIPF